MTNRIKPKITLKLTDREYKLLDDNKLIDSIQYVNGYSSRVCVDILVEDVDSFREFLNDEIKSLPRPLNEPSRIIYNNLKSILSKLESAVMIKENIYYNVLICEKCDGKGYPYQDDNIDCDECLGTGREISEEGK